MRIELGLSKPIVSMEDWASLYGTPRLRVHWKEGRSAHAIANFMLQRGGAERLRERVAGVIGEQVTFTRAVPEHEIRFDEFGRGRVHDVGIFGAAASGQSVFVGV